MDQKKTICIVALFCFFLALLPASAADAEDRPDFSGYWRINTFLSDSPIEEINRAAIGMMRAKRISESGSRRLDPGGRRRSDLTRGKEKERPDPEEMEMPFLNINLRAATLEITHEEPLLTIRYPDGQERSVFTDGREEKREYGYGPVETHALWKKKGRLVVKSKNDDGRVTTEKYELAMEGKQLKIVADVDGHGPTPSFRFTRYYDRTPSAETETEN